MSRRPIDAPASTFKSSSSSQYGQASSSYKKASASKSGQLSGDKGPYFNYVSVDPYTQATHGNLGLDHTGRVIKPMRAWRADGKSNVGPSRQMPCKPGDTKRIHKWAEIDSNHNISFRDDRPPSDDFHSNLFVTTTMSFDEMLAAAEMAKVDSRPPLNISRFSLGSGVSSGNGNSYSAPVSPRNDPQPPTYSSNLAFYDIPIGPDTTSTRHVNMRE